MMRRYALIIIGIFMLLSSYQGMAGESEESEERVVSLSLNEVSVLALKNNFDIQLARYDAYVKRNDLFESESIFDTIISGKITHTNDQKKTASTISGTKSLVNKYEINVEKKLPTGTTIETALEGERSWSDSVYSTTNPAHEAVAKIGITQEIGRNFFGLKDRGDIAITKLDIENSDYTSLEKIEKYLGEVQLAYWRIALKKEELAVKKALLRRAQHLYAIHKDKKELGLVESPELLASEANVKERERDILVAESELKNAQDELEFMLNLNPGVEVESSDKLSVDEVEMPLYVRSLNRAIDHRRDYIRAKNEVESSKIKIEVQKNNLWPQIDLELTFARNGLDTTFSKALQNIGKEDNPEYYFGINFSLSLENRDAKAKLSKAELEKMQRVLKLKSIERKIALDIDTGIRQLQIAISRYNLHKEIVQLQEDKLKEEERRFATGRSNTDMLIRYQDDLLTAQLLLAQYAFAVKEAEIQLALAEHTLLDKYWEGEL